MPQMIATDYCYVNEMFHKPGEKFDYDGPPSHAFHPVDGKPLPPLNLDGVFGKQVDALAGQGAAMFQKEIVKLQAAIKSKEEEIAMQAEMIDELSKENAELKAKKK